ncbi:MAG: HEAT repeat domain-containing protein, partial [Bacteroidetes bacterium]|nr:HEAT repeat domain-containing protein [Bacteroidota bacterium]
LWPVFGQLAAAIALLLMGYAAGTYLEKPASGLPADASTEITAMRQELSQLKDLLQQGATTGQRLQAVNVASTATNPDAELLMALVHTMHFDDNVNVRLAAVEALLNYRQYPQVRQALIHSLGIQTDPNVQLMLIQGLTQMQEKEALPQMQELLKDPALQKVVRQQLQESISILI